MIYTIDDIEIFITTYNRQQYLKETIENILTQTIGIKEITVVDNSSTDNTKEIVESFAHQGVKYVKTEGFMGNFNYIQQNAAKEYVMLFHDDDILNPKYIELALKELNKNDDIALVTTRYREFYNNDLPSIADIKEATFNFKAQSDFAEFLYFNEIVAYAPAIYKTEYFKKTDLEYDKYSKFNDWPFMVKIAGYGKSIIFKDVNMFFIRRHPGQDTWTTNNTPSLKQIVNWDECFYKAMNITTDDTATYIKFLKKMFYFAGTKYDLFLNPTDKEIFTKNDLVKEVLNSKIELDFNLMSKCTGNEKNNDSTLEIFLITYNRRKNLLNTFEQIFAENSPIRNLPITILDNKSTDGTSELIQEYRQNFPNIKHVIHNRNIGGNANIARAFELSSAKYVWVLCDDDTYDWSNWDEVEQAINNNYDLIVVANYLNPKKNKVDLIKQLTFVPAAIYKTEHITDTVMINTNYNISTMFPQLGIFSKYINDNLKIYICDNWAVKMVDNLEDASYTRGCVNNDLKHPYMTHCNWQFGFANAMQLFKDEDLKEELVENINLEKHIGVDGYLYILDLNRKYCNSSMKNLLDLFCILNEKQKGEFFQASAKFYGSKLIAELLDEHIKMLGLKKINFKLQKGYENEIEPMVTYKSLSFWDKLLPYITIRIEQKPEIIRIDCFKLFKTKIKKDTLKKIIDYSTIRIENTPDMLWLHFFKLFKTRIKKDTIKFIKDCSTIRFEKAPEALYIHFFKLFKTRVKLKKKLS